jgi:hypothetical protein
MARRSEWAFGAHPLSGIAISQSLTRSNTEEIMRPPHAFCAAQWGQQILVLLFGARTPRGTVRFLPSGDEQQHRHSMHPIETPAPSPTSSLTW